MSGGSHGYIGLCSDWLEVLDKRGHLPDIALRLAELGHMEAAEVTQAAYQRAADGPEHLEQLVAVWGMIDRYDSSDSGADDVARAVQAWRSAVEGAAGPQWVDVQARLRRRGIYSATLRQETDLQEPQVTLSLADLDRLLGSARLVLPIIPASGAKLTLSLRGEPLTANVSLDYDEGGAQ